MNVVCHFGDCHCADCHCADCHCAECHDLCIVIIIVVIVNVIMMSVKVPKKMNYLFHDKIQQTLKYLKRVCECHPRLQLLSWFISSFSLIRSLI